MSVSTTTEEELAQWKQKCTDLLRQAELGQCSRGWRVKRRSWIREHSPRFVWLGRKRWGAVLFSGWRVKGQRWIREYSPRFGVIYFAKANLDNAREASVS
jgi:hypothetical protein